jgi:hypothetical protein
MSLKKPKPKTPQEVAELIELFQGKIDRIRCGCSMCIMEKAMSHCAVDVLLWMLGKYPKEFSKIVTALKAKRASQTKHQCSHSE